MTQFTDQPSKKDSGSSLGEERHGSETPEYADMLVADTNPNPNTSVILAVFNNLSKKVED